MAFREDEFHALLEDPCVAKAAHGNDPRTNSGKSMKRPSLLVHESEPDWCAVPSSDAGGDTAPAYSVETVDRLGTIADAMVTADYVTECTQVFLVACWNSFDAALLGLGYEKGSIDDAVRMACEPLEVEITSWIKAFRHTINVDDGPPTVPQELPACFGTTVCSP